jgi:hypothetical protein
MMCRDVPGDAGGTVTGNIHAPSLPLFALAAGRTCEAGSSVRDAMPEAGFVPQSV